MIILLQVWTKISTMNDNNKIITELESEFVELYKILKFEGIAESGGAAKQVIADGRVSVNGEVETRKRKKISAGDHIEIEGQSIEVVGKTGKFDFWPYYIWSTSICFSPTVVNRQETRYLERLRDSNVYQIENQSN